MPPGVTRRLKEDEARLLANFVDLLEKMLSLEPGRRPSPKVRAGGRSYGWARVWMVADLITDLRLCRNCSITRSFAGREVPPDAGRRLRGYPSRIGRSASRSDGDDERLARLYSQEVPLACRR